MPDTKGNMNLTLKTCDGPELLENAIWRIKREAR